jgi:tRNA(Ile2) C34 agmatinyltransferase TiaS
MMWCNRCVQYMDDKGKGRHKCPVCGADVTIPTE